MEHRTGTREEWLTARRALLDAEKEHLRRGDELARRRRELPWVAIEKEYLFDTEQGTRTLPELFDGRSQLLVYTSCSAPGSGSTSGARGAPAAPSSPITSTAPFLTSTATT